MGLKIAADHRAAFFGKTGAGKSFAVKHLLYPCTRLVVCDVKGKLDPDWRLMPWKEGYSRLLRGQPARVRIPPLTRAQWDSCFADLFRLRGVIIYLDELYNVGPPSGSEGLTLLCTQGRALGIGVWAASQRPVKIPGFILSESEHIFSFQLRRKADRETIADTMGIPAYPRLTQHAGLYFNDQLEQPIAFKSITDLVPNRA